MADLPIFKQLTELLHWILVNINDALVSLGLGPNWTWGLAIIGLTVIVRLVLFPLTWKQFASALAMQALQPKIKELQQKHKGDRATLQAETMRMYQEHRVNPFASCLPIVLQLPVFIALYYAIRGTSYLDHAQTLALSNASFLWIPHLGQPDPTYVLLVLYVVTQLISTELMLTAQTDKSQKMLMRAMPIVFVFFLFNFPAGLFVYWVTTNLWTIGQQLIIRKVMKPKDLAVMSAAPARRSRFMEAMMGAQQSRAKTREDVIAERRAKAAGSAKTGGGQGSAKRSGGQPASKKGARKPPPGKVKRRASQPPRTKKGDGGSTA